VLSEDTCTSLYSLSRSGAGDESLFVTSLGAASTAEAKAKEDLADKKRRKGEKAKLVAAAKGRSHSLSFLCQRISLSLLSHHPLLTTQGSSGPSGWGREHARN
jgi:hypothetical protein